MASADTTPAKPEDGPTDSHESYKAPLEESEYPDVVPGLYVVWLTPGYTVEEHVSKLGGRVKSAIEWSLDMDDVFVYKAKLDDELLRMIRADRGVTKVTCDRYSSAPPTQ